ncbi:M18 family aminopeptidase [Ornithinimicrobium faecis]|uniref:M18 family aminopeptidase n=1 Tax=Ornithinimicrobium faecis TaxID=2934158 RepID=UPI0021197FF3|nr:M18 family aminopeptidase [Ornithinimicrobium sp. HY1745]
MPHAFDQDDTASRLAAYLDASPSPFHAVESTAALLLDAGFTRVAETDPTPADPGRYLTVRGGSLIAWSTEADLAASAPFRVVGAHTDSPNLRIKPRPDVLRSGWQQLAVEVYGGPLLNTWLDRDLGLSGRVALRADTGIEGRLLLIDEPLLRVSQLAPHLDRTVNSEGLKLNPQQHLVPHWGQGETPGDLVGFVAEHLDVAADDILGWDLMTHDLTPARRIGRDRDLLASARLDNLATSFAATIALIAAVEAGVPGVVPVIALFDHEEVGSTTERGAQSTFLTATLERIVLSRGGSREDYLRALAGTVIASGDMAHATNPNYAERHEPGHHVQMNGGPVLKINAQARYATDGLGAAAFRLACDQAGVPVQSFVTRTDLPCGSTVGPMTSALTGATTVDFGAPTLSMHSTREACGVADQAMYAGALEAFLSPA